MSYSFTGFAYLILVFALGCLIYRFFQYWRKEKDIISKCFLCIAVLFEIFAFSKAIGGLFFANNLVFLETTIDIVTFIQALAFAVLAYLIIHLKFPRISPWLGFIPVFVLGLIATGLSIITAYHPFLEPSGAINWGLSSVPLTLSLLRILLFFITFVPMSIIFSQQFKIAKEPYVKKKTFVMIIFFLFAFTVALLDFLFIGIFKLEAIWRDITLIILSIILFLISIISPKPSPRYIKRI